MIVVSPLILLFDTSLNSQHTLLFSVCCYILQCVVQQLYEMSLLLL